jgi:hypothetical protein
MNRAKQPMLADSQCSRILGYLGAGHTLTPLQALRKFGTLRLGARCYELRQRGHDIRSEIVERGGKRVALYRLA